MKILMEDSLIANCELEGSNGSKEEVGVGNDTNVGKKKSESDSCTNPSPKKIRVHSNVIHPLSGGAMNCLLAVDNVVRATTDYGSPRKVALTAASLNIDDEDKDELLIPLQNTRHLFVREYKKPFTWPTQATRKFQVLNSSGDCIYFAAERSSFFSRILFFRGIFPYKINVLSLNGEPVMEIRCRPCFNNCITIYDSRGELIGRIRKVHNLCAQSYSLKTWDGTGIMNIIGPDGSNCCLFANCGNEDFEVNLGNGTTSIGKISSQWDYALEDLCGVFVPMKLDELTMSILLGAVFLIDFNFYQRRRDASSFGRCFLTIVFFVLFILMLFLIAKK